MKNQTVVDMKRSQFPFGQIETEDPNQVSAVGAVKKKLLIRKRIYYKSQKEHCGLKKKIDILKEIYHKNTINFREVEDDEQSCFLDLYYNYVPFALEDFFEDSDTETMKEVHKQLIQLAIHLAKNNLLTSFNPSRCGVLLNADNHWQIKYYLPLKEIVVTDNVAMLERSVQLFTVQSLHFLDSLSQAGRANTLTHCGTQDQNPEQDDFTDYDQGPLKGHRKQSQPFSNQVAKERRFSNQAALLKFSTNRKLSSISRQRSQFSGESLKPTNASTLFHTLRSSSPATEDMKRLNSTLTRMLKKSPTKDQILERAQEIVQRSEAALQEFNGILRTLSTYKEISVTLNRLNQKSSTSAD